MNPYLVRLRELAQSILAGVQSLEDASATDADETYAAMEERLSEADDAVGNTVEWINEGRPDL